MRTTWPDIVQPFELIMVEDDLDREIGRFLLAADRDRELDEWIELQRALDREIVESLDRGVLVDLDAVIERATAACRG